jgi:hypothetical protein
MQDCSLQSGMPREPEMLLYSGFIVGFWIVESGVTIIEYGLLLP